MPYGKGTYGSKVGRPKKKKQKMQAGKKTSKDKSPTYTIPSDGASKKKKGGITRKKRKKK